MTHLESELNHYISHCKNENCASKEKCYRYRAHKELEKMGLTHKPYTYINQNGTMNDCKAFIEQLNDKEV